VRSLVLIAVLAARAGGAAAAPGPTPARCDETGGEASFGPRVVIRAIEVRGNTTTATKLILRALPVASGDCLATDDPRLRVARYKVLALGHFRDVELRFARGAARGEVVLIVEVVERGALVLNRVFLGSSRVTPWWAGLDAGDRNLFGLGLGLSGAFVVAGEGDAAGAHAQHAAALRVDDPSLTGGAFGWRGSIHLVDASEPFRIDGAADDGDADHFAAFDHRRLGGRLGGTYNLTPLTRVALDGRYEAVRADLPAAPVRTRPDGTTEPIDLHLEDGASRVVTLAASIERDSRPDPVLPYAGTHLALTAEVAVPGASSYRYATVLGRYEQWWRVTARGVVSAHLAAGATFGDTPRFDRLYVGDLARYLSPRALGLVVAAAPPVDAFGMGTDEVTYGELGGIAEVQWAYQLFRGGDRVHGGDLFVGAGVWGLAERRGDARALDLGGLDVLLDAGLRLDTEVGVFELSIANGVGRLPR
jgi:hypothetical protein